MEKSFKAEDIDIYEEIVTGTNRVMLNEHEITESAVRGMIMTCMSLIAFAGNRDYERELQQAGWIAIVLTLIEMGVYTREHAERLTKIMEKNFSVVSGNAMKANTEMPEINKVINGIIEGYENGTVD